MSYPQNPQATPFLCTFWGKNLNFQGRDTNKRPPNYAQIKLIGGVVSQLFHKGGHHGKPSTA